MGVRVLLFGTSALFLLSLAPGQCGESRSSNKEDYASEHGLSFRSPRENHGAVLPEPGRVAEEDLARRSSQGRFNTKIEEPARSFVAAADRAADQHSNDDVRRLAMQEMADAMKKLDDLTEEEFRAVAEAWQRVARARAKGRATR